MEYRKITLDKKKLQAYQNMLFPLSFVFSSLLNLLFFYLGFAYEDNIVRQYGFIIGCVLFAIACGLTLLFALRINKLPIRTWIFLGIVVLFYGVSFAVGFYKFGLNSTLLGYAQQFIAFSAPAFLTGIYGAMHRGEQTFFPTLESFSFLAFPGALIYANSVVFDCLPWNYGANLGIIGYMSLAYTFMPFLLAHLICFAERAEWKVPFIGKKVQRPQILRGIFIGVYWVAIIASVTRGAYVCVAGFCVLFVISRLIHRERVKPVFLVSLAMAALLLFNLFIYAPPGLYRLSRVNIFLDGLKEGQLVTTTGEDQSITDRIDELVQADGDQQITNRPETDPDSLDDPIEGVAEENLQIGNRGTMYTLAVREFLKNPVFGMGPGGYTIKYGMHPHNVVLELLCETGLVGVLILIPILLYVIVRLFLAGRTKKEFRNLLLFFIAYAIQANISGSLWQCSALLCALGYGISMLPPSKQAAGQEGNYTLETK